MSRNWTTHCNAMLCKHHYIIKTNMHSHQTRSHLSANQNWTCFRSWRQCKRFSFSFHSISESRYLQLAVTRRLGLGQRRPTWGRKNKPKCVIAGWEKTRVGAHNAPNTLDPKGHSITNNSSVFPGWFVQQFRCLGWVVFKHLTGTQNNTQGVFL